MSGRSNKDVHDPRNDDVDDRFKDPVVDTSHMDDQEREEYWREFTNPDRHFIVYGDANRPQLLRRDGTFTSDWNDPNLAYFKDKTDAQKWLNWEMDTNDFFIRNFRKGDMPYVQLFEPDED